ncbi:hypothetical protein O5O45_26700 [Hahella aquimaris]|uniref:hypothetical protein n=1 Tax=Hahella sp. HNIBRBA332 TaxID=3015983 RepID=UPI00273B6260|nr:hypothetical protein [Hahella sp. HNIBRBA332]WLQ13317.1 hypothetical protein O5O45_26700 [Hahella sp. HNIBRBA332]
MDAFTFDAANFLIGILVGAVASLFLKLNSLKTLGLKLDKIGLDLGVEGFENESARNSISINFDGNNSSFGDVTTGNIDKSVVNSKFYRNIKHVLTAGSQRIAKILRQERIEIISDDLIFRERLDSIPRKDDWFQKYINECLSSTSFRNQIIQRMQQFEANGWNVETMNFDNTKGGLVIIFEVSRRFHQ